MPLKLIALKPLSDEIEGVAQDLAPGDGAGVAGAAGDVDARAVGEQVVEDVVALDDRAAAARSRRCRSSRRRSGSRSSSTCSVKLSRDDLDRLVVAGVVRADLHALDRGVRRPRRRSRRCRSCSSRSVVIVACVAAASVIGTSPAVTPMRVMPGLADPKKRPNW